MEAEMMRYRYFFPFIGNMGNCMLQILIALALMDRLGKGSMISADDRFKSALAMWQINFNETLEQTPQSYKVCSPISDIDALARDIIDANATDIVIETCNLSMSQYPALDTARGVFQNSIPQSVSGFGDEYLVINVRGAEILSGIHRDYVVAPVSFYKYLIEKTKLKPVFVGQIRNDIYSNAIKAAFPEAIYCPSAPSSDFQILRKSANIVICVSTFSLLAGWLSEAKTIFMPLLGAFNPNQRPDSRNYPRNDARYRFFLFPVYHMRPIDSCFDDLNMTLSTWREVDASSLPA